jgi:hypothetical protein
MMRAVQACVVLGTVATLTVPGIAAGSERGTGRDRGGHVVPCSLDGVNPAYHPEIFGNPAAARSFGFVMGPGGTWHVSAGCSSSARYRY